MHRKSLSRTKFQLHGIATSTLIESASITHSDRNIVLSTKPIFVRVMSVIVTISIIDMVNFHNTESRHLGIYTYPPTTWMGRLSCSKETEVA